MRTGRVLIAIGLLLIPAVAAADGHRAGAFFGYSRASGSSLNGVIFAVDYSPDQFKAASIMGDVSINSGPHRGSDVTRVTWSLGANAGRSVFVEWLVANGHAGVGGVSGDGSSDGVGILGVSVDLRVHEKFTIRTQADASHPRRRRRRLLAVFDRRRLADPPEAGPRSN